MGVDRAGWHTSRAFRFDDIDLTPIKARATNPVLHCTNCGTMKPHQFARNGEKLWKNYRAPDFMQSHPPNRKTFVTSIYKCTKCGEERQWG